MIISIVLSVITFIIKVLDEDQMTRLFIDPMKGQKHQVIDYQYDPDIMKLIDQIRSVHSSRGLMLD